MCIYVVTQSRKSDSTFRLHYMIQALKNTVSGKRTSNNTTVLYGEDERGYEYKKEALQRELIVYLQNAEKSEI